MDPTSASSASGVGERLVYLQVELSLVLFLPLPGTEPSSSANGSISKRDPYDVLARLMNAGEDHSSPIFVPIAGRFADGVLVCRLDGSGSGVGARAGAVAGSSGAGWSRSIFLISSESSCLN